MIQIHGGGWFAGERGDENWVKTKYDARQAGSDVIGQAALAFHRKHGVPLTVIDVDYRLTTQSGLVVAGTASAKRWGNATVGHPAQLEDCADAVAFVLRHAAEVSSQSQVVSSKL